LKISLTLGSGEEGQSYSLKKKNRSLQKRMPPNGGQTEEEGRPVTPSLRRHLLGGEKSGGNSLDRRNHRSQNVKGKSRKNPSKTKNKNC